MNEFNEETEAEDVKKSIDEHLTKTGIKFEIIDCDYDDGSWRATVEVERKDYHKTLTIDSYFDNFYISFKQKRPPLIQAEVGNLVLIYDEYSSTEEESSIGLVTFKSVQDDGTTSYGCRHIKIGLHDNFVHHMYDFELTDDAYGGHPDGFLRVLTQEEAQEHLRKKLEIAFEKEKKAVQEKYERSSRNLPHLISRMLVTNKMKVEKIEIKDIPFYVNCHK